MTKKTISLITGFTLIFAIAFGATACNRSKGSAESKATEETPFTFKNGIITKYNGMDTDVTIPSKINGQAVTGIGEYAFPSKVMDSITIGANLELEYPAFHLDNGFDYIYNNNGKQAGTYTADKNGRWSLDGTPFLTEEEKDWAAYMEVYARDEAAYWAQQAERRTYLENLYHRVIELQTPRMNGEDVKELQTRLLSLGYSSVGEADGYYGPATEQAVKEVQARRGIDVNGKVDRDLWDNIFSDK